MIMGSLACTEVPQSGAAMVSALEFEDLRVKLKEYLVCDQ
jgi:hypothetical protein